VLSYIKQQKGHKKRVGKKRCVLVQMDDVHETVAHSHPASAAAAEVIKSRARMKEAVQTSRARPAQVLSAATVAAPVEVRAEMGNRESLRRELRRWKRAAHPPEPASLAAIQLASNYQNTGGPNPQRFLIHDSGTAAPRRMLVFASAEQLRQLASARRYAVAHVVKNLRRAFLVNWASCICNETVIV